MGGSPMVPWRLAAPSMQSSTQKVKKAKATPSLGDSKSRNLMGSARSKGGEGPGGKLGVVGVAGWGTGTGTEARM
ncbi:unnamed protein product [Ilex paraguariensis]|uniref:Uncharacterized protein n=1 Tax=Ilex paraguariensis TaxID=185542 RepID=A0ABC8SFT5_9AQUA